MFYGVVRVLTVFGPAPIMIARPVGGIWIDLICYYTWVCIWRRGSEYECEENFCLYGGGTTMTTNGDIIWLGREAQS